MNYPVIPLIYAANERFKNTIRFAVEFVDDVDPEALRYATAQVQRRYPYFSLELSSQVQRSTKENFEGGLPAETFTRTMIEQIDL